MLDFPCLPGGRLKWQHFDARLNFNSLHEAKNKCELTDILLRRQYEESWRKMQELRAQIQAQLRLAEHLRKLGEQGGGFDG